MFSICFVGVTVLLQDTGQVYPELMYTVISTACVSLQKRDVLIGVNAHEMIHHLYNLEVLVLKKKFEGTEAINYLHCLECI